MKLKQLRAVFRLSPNELYELVVYGRLLGKKKSSRVIDPVCKALDVRAVIMGVRYIDDGDAQLRAKKSLPKRSYPTCDLIVSLDSGRTPYLTASSAIINREVPAHNDGRLKVLRDYFRGATDHAIVLGQLDPVDIVNIEIQDPRFIRALAGIQPSLSWWERFEQQFK